MNSGSPTGLKTRPAQADGSRRGATAVGAPAGAGTSTLGEAHVDRIQQSHLRCATLGLSRIERPDYSPLGRSDLNVVRDRNLRLHTHAAPVMEMLFEQIVNSQSMVVLTDAMGTVLHAIGDDDFLGRASKVALSPGANWSESAKGTNAVGTALIEETPTLVHADDHYMHANHFLTCSAAPILDPRGNILGVLDVSGDHRSYHQHTMGLVKMSARMIENHWLTDDYRNVMRLHFHSRVEFIGTLMEGILAVSEDGRIVGANRGALEQLGLSGAALRMHSLPSLFGTSVAALVDRFRSPLALPMPVELHGGRQFHVVARFNWPVWHGGMLDPETGTPTAFGVAGPGASVLAGGLAGRAPAALASADAAGAAGQPVGESGAAHPSGPDAGPAGYPSPSALEATDTSADPAGARPASQVVGAGRNGLRSLATGDAQIGQLIDKIRKVLNRDIPILVLGETGTGKELLARAIHQDSDRARQPFVAVNCASIPDTLIEAELFGYEEGAFTGARRKGSVGKIVQANGGTLFLDEIGDMPIALQAHLLRVLQERQVTPLGSTKSVAVDVTIICATHRNLREMIAAKSFREDLYYRLNGLAVRLPPLRERSDLEALVMRILERECPDRRLHLGPEVQQLFRHYQWPGNVRQLFNVLRTACVMAAGDTLITLDHLSDDFIEDARRSAADAQRLAADTRMALSTGGGDQAGAASGAIGSMAPAAAWSEAGDARSSAEAAGQAISRSPSPAPACAGASQPTQPAVATWPLPPGGVPEGVGWSAAQAEAAASAASPWLSSASSYPNASPASFADLQSGRPGDAAWARQTSASPWGAGPARSEAGTWPAAAQTSGQSQPSRAWLPATPAGAGWSAPGRPDAAVPFQAQAHGQAQSSGQAAASAQIGSCAMHSGSASVGGVSGAAEPAVAPLRSLEDIELFTIRQAVDAAGGNISVAAKTLGISRNTIYRKLRWNQSR